MTDRGILVDDELRLKQRIKSFTDWKFQKNFIPLAAAGFRFTGELDRVKCDYCNKKVVQWAADDDPIEVHARFSPDCIFLRSLGYSTRLPIPRYSRFSFYSDRLESVQTVPEIYHPNLPSFEGIAESGFFYQGTLDRMTCYFCGVILKDWEASTEPFHIHLRFRPQCVHILKTCQLRNAGHYSLETDIPDEVNLQLVSLRENSCCRKIGQSLVDAGGIWTNIGESEGGAAAVSGLDRTEDPGRETRPEDSGQEGLEEDSVKEVQPIILEDPEEAHRHRGKLCLDQNSRHFVQHCSREEASRNNKLFDETDAGLAETTDGSYSDAGSFGPTNDKDLTELFEIKKSLEAIEFPNDDLEDSELFDGPINHQVRIPEVTDVAVDKTYKNKESSFDDGHFQKNNDPLQVLGNFDDINDETRDASDDYRDKAQDDFKDETEDNINSPNKITFPHCQTNVERIFVKYQEICLDTEAEIFQNCPDYFSLPDLRWYGLSDPDLREMHRQKQECDFDSDYDGSNQMVLSDLSFGYDDSLPLNVYICTSLPTEPRQETNSFDRRKRTEYVPTEDDQKDCKFAKSSTRDTKQNKCKTNESSLYSRTIKFISKKIFSLPNLFSKFNPFAIASKIGSVGRKKSTPYVRVRCMPDLKTIVLIVIKGKRTGLIYLEMYTSTNSIKHPK